MLRAMDAAFEEPPPGQSPTVFPQTKTAAARS